jgi:AcrR family transcriptional regulator
MHDMTAQGAPDGTSESPRTRRDAIMDAAMEVFGAKGLDGASVEDIARAAGIGKGTVYLYFRSKDEIFDAILGERWPGPYLERFMPAALARMESQETPLEDVLAAFANGFLLAVEQNMLVLRLVFSEAYRFPDRAEHLFETTFLRANRLLAAFLEGQAQAGRIRPLDSPAVTARCFQGMLMTYVLSQELLGGRKFTPIAREDWVSEAVRIFLHGIGAAGGQPAVGDGDRRQ